MFDKVLQIGINYYDTQYQLGGCINDVENLHEFLTENFDCSKTQFRHLRDDSKDASVYPNHQNIMEAFKWLTEGATSKSKLFIHYSGHGAYTRDARKGDETDGQDETICPARGPQIIDDILRKCLVDPLPKDCHLWALFDCCHSGTVLDLKYNYQVKLNPRTKDWKILSNNKARQSRAKAVLISGCMDRQTSADAWEPDNKTNKGEYQGAMTYSFIKTVKNLIKQKSPLKYRKIMKQMCSFLKARGYEQIPQISSGHWMDLEEEIFKC
jgi:hypothetical protein